VSARLHRLGPWLGASAALAVLLTLLVSASGAPPPPASTPDGGLSPTVKISFMTVPPPGPGPGEHPDKVTIFWGRKPPLGIIKTAKKPLVIERPRDSGPMDVVIRAEGYLPVHTRAYTFNDAKIFVKLTKIEDKKTLFGYREELPDAGPEAGVPPVTGPMTGPMMGPPGPPAAPDGGAPTN
jgi:hypothetical protein